MLPVNTMLRRTLCLLRTICCHACDTVCCVITAKAQYNLANAKSYFREHLAVGDYYREGQKVSGEWFGEAATALGLTGAVSETEFFALCENEHPQTGHCLTQRKNTVRQEGRETKANRRVFYDFTFSPPKSVSVAALVAGDERVIEAHKQAVRAALSEFETFAATRIRKNKARDFRLTKNIVAALFSHDTSRALDPHLHTHCVVFNATHDPKEDRWKALENQEMLKARKYAEAVYYHELAKDLRRFGYRIRSRARGDFEIEGVSEELCTQFSKRHEQINEAQAALLRQKPELSSVNQQDVREWLATAERLRKIKDMDRSELKRLWSAQLSEQETASLKTLTQASVQSASRVESDKSDEAVQWAEDHLFDRCAVVPEHEIWRQALIWARGQNVSASALKKTTSDRGYVRDESQVTNVTTREVLGREWEIVRAGSEGVSAFGPFVHSLPVMPETFAKEQSAALTRLLLSRDFITLFRGGAGTGKSYVLKSVVEHLREADYPVITLAPQRQQVRDLAASGFPSPTTLADFLTRKAMKGRAVVVLDEAGQVSGKQMVELVRLVQSGNGRLILSGDTRQHGPVEASDAMLALERYAGLKPAELRKIRRQNPKLGRANEEKRAIRRYRRAVADAAAGKLAESFTGLEQLGAVVACPLGDQSERLAEEYLRLAEAEHSLVVVAQTWNEVHKVNECVRAKLRKKGLLGSNETEVEALEHVDLTNAQKRDGRYYPPCAPVVFNQPVGRVPRGAKGTFISTVERGVLIEVGRDWHLVAHKQLDRITVCQPRKISLALGDKLQLKANHRMASGTTVTNGEIVTVKSVHADGRIALRDGRTLDASYREFVPGYAVTSYGSQGKTMDYVLFSDSAVRAATNSRQWYVTISRGRRGIRIFTPDKTALRENVLRSGDSMLALDLIGRARTRHLLHRQPTRLWRRWTQGWNSRVRNLLAMVKSRRLMQPKKTETYGHKIN
jgi:conjugative relaxase-like TrwC/TraI family protein